MTDEWFGYLFLHNKLLQNITDENNNHSICSQFRFCGKNTSRSLRGPMSYEPTGTWELSSAQILVSKYCSCSSAKGTRIPWRNGWSHGWNRKIPNEHKICCNARKLGSVAYPQSEKKKGTCLKNTGASLKELPTANGGTNWATKLIILLDLTHTHTKKSISLYWYKELINMGEETTLHYRKIQINKCKRNEGKRKLWLVIRQTLQK